jgi:DNA-binding SARP family transcriptional activator/tetratricopeptide (TPR) repeat protein
MSKVSAGEIRLLCIGDARIITPKCEIDPSAEVAFAAALCLILERQKRTARKQLQELLWPSADPATAAHRLRQTIFKLRRAGFPVESDGKSRVFLDAEQINTDFEEFENLGGAAPGIESISLPLFASFFPTFSATFSDWLDVQKTKIGAVLSRILLQRMAQSRAAGDWHVVEQEALALLRHAPLNEEGTLALAESLAMRGDKIQAVRILDEYLAEVGGAASDLRVAANTMRKRIADRMPPSSATGPYETPLVGRETYMQQLGSRMSAVRTVGAQACIIWGDPGIGKSRLVTEFLTFAALQGATCHRIFCRGSDCNRPLATILEIIPLLRAMRGSIGSSPDTLSFLDGLTTHRPKARQHASPSTLAHPVRSKLDLALADIVDAVCEESAMVLAVEDCQWMDAPSAAIFERLISRLAGQRIFLLFTSRVVDDGPFSESFTGLGEMRLEALSDTPAAHLVETSVRRRGREVSASYLTWATRVAEGNPFFLHELASHWVETGDEHSVPPSLTAVLRQRLSRLSPNALQVLQSCALLENHSSLENVETLLGYAAHELLSSVNELAAAGMVTVAEHDSTGGYRINSKHDLLSEVALNQLSAPGRSYLHRRAAKVLESRIQQTGDASTLWSCAKHWQLAGDGMQAFRLADSCARHLLEAGMLSEAASAFEKALDYCRTDAERLTVLEGQLTARYRSSDWSHVLQLGAKAREIRARLFPEVSSHDPMELMVRRAEWQTMEWNHILHGSLECLAATEATVSHRLEAGIMALMLMSPTENKEEGTATYSLIQNLGESPDAPRDLRLQASMIFNSSWGSHVEAATAAIELVAEHRSKNDIGELFRALCNAGVTLRVAGQFDQAADYFHQALRLADQHRIQLSKSRAIPMLANMAIEQGHVEEARNWLEALRHKVNTIDDPLVKMDIITIDARLALIDGRWNDVSRMVEVDLIDMSTDQIPHRRAYWKALRVAGQLASAGQASVEAVTDLENEHLRTRGNVFQAFASFTLYTGLISVGERRKAKVLLDEYLTTYRREPWPPPEHLLDSLLALRERKRPRQPRPQETSLM